MFHALLDADYVHSNITRTPRAKRMRNERMLTFAVEKKSELGCKGRAEKTKMAMTRIVTAMGDPAGPVDLTLIRGFLTFELRMASAEFSVCAERCVKANGPFSFVVFLVPIISVKAFSKVRLAT